MDVIFFLCSRYDFVPADSKTLFFFDRQNKLSRQKHPAIGLIFFCILSTFWTSVSCQTPKKKNILASYKLYLYSGQTYYDEVTYQASFPPPFFFFFFFLGGGGSIFCIACLILTEEYSFSRCKTFSSCF